MRSFLGHDYGSFPIGTLGLVRKFPVSQVIMYYQFGFHYLHKHYPYIIYERII